MYSTTEPSPVDQGNPPTLWRSSIPAQASLTPNLLGALDSVGATSDDGAGVSVPGVCVDGTYDVTTGLGCLIVLIAVGVLRWWRPVFVEENRLPR